MTRIFSTSLLLLTITLTCTDARAQNYAVSSFNGELSALATKIDGPEDFKIYAASVNGNIPLAGYLGLNLYATRGHGKVVSVSTSLDYSYDYLRYAVSPFIRDPKLGFIGLSVAHTTFDYDGRFTKAKQKDLSLLAAGYFGPMTLSATGTRSQDPDGIGTDQNYSWIDAVWYALPDFLIDVTAGFKDAKDSYTIAFEHQPSTMLPQFSYGLGYSWNNYDSKTILLTLTYRFAEKKSLMRRYREDLFGPR